MSDLVEIAGTGDLQDGMMKAVEVSGQRLLLARAGGSFFLTQSLCPHLGGDLVRGRLDGTIVTCPRHHSQFDLTDGHVVRWTDWPDLVRGVSEVIRPPRPLRTYPVQVEGDKVLVDREMVGTG